MNSIYGGLWRVANAFAFFSGLFLSDICSAQFVPSGPEELKAVEVALFDFDTIGAMGIWPREEILQAGRLSDLPAEKSEKVGQYLDRALNLNVLPREESWDKLKWTLLEKPFWPRSYFVTNVTSIDAEISRIEMQCPRQGHNVIVTFRSDSLFPNRAFSQKEVQVALNRCLALPEEFKSHMSMERKVVLVGETSVTYGEICDARDIDPNATVTELFKPEGNYTGRPKAFPGIPEPTGGQQFRPKIPDAKRDWYSPLHYCIFSGRLTVGLSTLDFKRGELPRE